MSLCSNCKILTIPTKEKSYVKLNDRNSEGGIMTRLRAGRSMVLIPVGARYFSLLQNVWTDSRAQLATYPTVTGCYFPWQSGRRVKLNSRLAHRLRIRGAIPLIHLYAIMAWRGTTLPVPLYYTDCPQSFTQSN